MSIKILTMRNINWWNFWRLVLRISVLLVMLINPFMVGVVQICKISLILKRIIQKQKLFYWKKIIVQPRKSCKQQTRWLITIAIVVRKNCGRKMLTVSRLSITVRVMNVKKQSLSLLRLTILSAKKARTSKILQFYTVLMRNHVPLKKLC